MVKKTIIAIAVFGLATIGANAQSLLGTTTNLLGPDVTPTGGYSANSQEYITVITTVTPVGNNEYEYTYQISNPTGDELMNNNGTLQAGTSEIVDEFNVSFNAAFPGAVVSGPYGGNEAFNIGTSGIDWLLSSIAPGTSSPILSFLSDLPPTLANAEASDSSPPSPWASSNPGGAQVPVPDVIPTPEPNTLSLLIMTAVGFGPARSMVRRLGRRE